MKAGLQIKRLGDVATLQRGFDLPVQDRLPGEFPLVSSSGISDTHSVGAVQGPGVVTGRSGSIGKVFFIEGSFWPLNTVLYVKDFHGNDPRFVFYLLMGFDLQRFASGTGVPTLNRNFVHGELVTVPSVLEQQRIAGILDQAFVSIDTARANTEKNLEYAHALFESYLQSAFVQRGETWVEKPLGDLASFRNGINYTKDSKGERVKIVGVKDFQDNFYAPLDDLDTVTIDGALGEMDSLKPEDILTVRSNGNIELIGRCILVGEVTEKTSHSGFTIRIRLSNGKVLPRYLCHFMKSAGSRKRLTDGGTGTNIKSLNQRMLSSWVVPLPPIAAQRAIVENLERLSEETQQLESLYHHKLAALDALKKSLLHQAVTGQL